MVSTICFTAPVANGLLQHHLRSFSGKIRWLGCSIHKRDQPVLHLFRPRIPLLPKLRAQDRVLYGHSRKHALDEIRYPVHSPDARAPHPRRFPVRAGPIWQNAVPHKNRTPPV